MKVYDPRIKVTLLKTVKRTNVGGVPVSQRFSGIGQRIDLSPYLGEGSSVSTRKNIREPAGAFSLQLLDRPFVGYVDVPLEQLPPGQTSMQAAESIYGIVEPMDVIEIRMRHGGAAASGEPPIVMRGFVSFVGRGEAMGNDGRPVRVVQVQGQDYGKLWQQLQIRYLPGYIVGQDFITAFRRFEKFGGGFQIAQPAGEFVADILTSILNPYLQGFTPADSPAVATITLDDEALGAVHGTVSLTGPQNFEGTIYNLLQSFLDVGPWNELFLEDRDDGVYLVLRPNPYKDASGNLIPEGALTPTVIDIAGDAVQSLNVSRTDQNISNYYWVRSPRFEMTHELARRQQAVTADEQQTVVLKDYENCAEALYGIRLMEVDTQMGGDAVTNFGTGLPAAQVEQQRSDQVEWINTRRKLLVAMNKDNVLFESGQMRARGDETIKPGSYVRVTRGQFVSEYYVPEVTHDWIWGQGFLSGLRLERGTGFIERAKRNGGKDSPYYSELMS
jgi:hypothetical protein